MRAARYVAVIALAITLTVDTSAWALGWRDAFTMHPNADVLPTLELAAATLLPLNELPSEANGLGGYFGGFVLYTDNHKFAQLTVARADYYMTWRSLRGRYDADSFPATDFFNLTVQLQAMPRLHLIYGLGIARSGIMTHASSAGLAFRFGWALPLIGRRAETMRDYRRSFLQIEGLPLVGSLLTNHDEEGYFDFERPRIQVQGEVALVGRLRTLIGTFEAESRLSASYQGQHSMFFSIGIQWTRHVFWRRFAGTFHSQYTVPLRPFSGHESSDMRRITQQHHLSYSFGMLIYLTVPEIQREDTREQRLRSIDEYFEESRREREERQSVRREEREERRARRGVRRRPRGGRLERDHRERRQRELRDDQLSTD